MKRVLIVAYYFPPTAASGSLRPLAFAKYLREFDWEPMVLTTEPESITPPLRVDSSLLEGVPEDLTIFRVPHSNPGSTLVRWRDRIRKKLFTNGSSHEKKNACDPISFPDETDFVKGTLRLAKDRLWDWLFAFPDSQKFWIRPALRFMDQIPIEKRPDLVFATGSPWTALLLGKELAQRFRVPLIADFRDPWTNNPYKKVFSPKLTRRAKQLEKLVCLEASRVLATTLELSQQFQSEYPECSDKFVTITNGFDEIEQEVSARSRNNVPFGDGCNPGKVGLEICHFGTIYGTRNPVELFKAVQELFEERKLTQGEIRFRFVGDWNVTDETCEKLGQKLESEGFLIRQPPISHEECLQQMSQAEVLLILQPASPLQIPGKIYEYLALGRAILIIGGEGATTSLVKRFQLGRCCSNQAVDIKGFLSNLINGHEEIPTVQTEHLAKFHYRGLTGQLASVLDGCLQNT